MFHSASLSRVQITRVSQRQAAKPAPEPQGSATPPGEAPAIGTREPGYIATLKDNYGFITCASAPCLPEDAYPSCCCAYGGMQTFAWVHGCHMPESWVVVPARFDATTFSHDASAGSRQHRAATRTICYLVCCPYPDPVTQPCPKLKSDYNPGRCANREARLFFHFSEARFPKASIAEGAEVSVNASINTKPPLVHDELRRHLIASFLYV